MKMHHMPVYKLPRGFDLVEPALSESEIQDPCMKWFAGFKNEFSRIRDEVWPYNLYRMDTEELRSLFAKDVFPDSIRPRMRFVGIGATRMVFVSDTNVAFKFQYNDYHDQGRREITEALAWPGLRCFPRLLDYSEDCQCCAFEVACEPTPEEFSRTFDRTPQQLCNLLIDYGQTGSSAYLSTMIESNAMNEEQALALQDLADFFRRTYLNQKKDIVDLDHIDNWGLMYRNGQPVILVTDFGL